MSKRQEQRNHIENALRVGFESDSEFQDAYNTWSRCQGNEALRKAIEDIERMIDAKMQKGTTG